MTEESILMDLGEVTLEGRLAAGARQALWVIAHPLPRYGGTMGNNVVLAARDALADLGFSTLRFNFRGVGRSTGAEANDLRDADDLRRLLSQVAGRPEARDGIFLAGYSFGAWAALGAVAQGAQPEGLMLFSPPLDFLDFDGCPLPDVDCLVTLGDRDSFCAAESFDAWWRTQPAATGRRERQILTGGDHFYGGQEAALRRAITAFLG